MFKNGEVVNIQTDKGMFVGRVGGHDGNRIMLKKVCRCTPTIGPDKKADLKLKSIGLDLIFYGNMIVNVLSDNDTVVAKYKQALSPIILQGNA